MSDRSDPPRHERPRAADTPADAAAETTADAAAQTSWRIMRELVLDHDRRHEIAEALGLSFARVRALKKIVQEQPLTMRELAARLQTDPPYATRIVDDLEQLGLVARSADARDRRAKLVSLTPAGEALADRAGELLDVPPARLLALPPEDLAALARIMSRLEP